MKVDIVVNSMVQQIDRSLKTQAVPPASFRPGELLRGRVMLSGDDRQSIRLDNGMLLDAMPAGGVLLRGGATVTLRVSGKVDGQLVMQLMDQEMTTGVAAADSDTGDSGEAAGQASNATPQGRAVLRALESMNQPLHASTVRQALEILSAFPGLEPEKAAFLAANRMNATQTNVNALNSLLGGSTVGGELLKLADLLSAQALQDENVRIAEDFQNAPPEAEPLPAGQGSVDGQAAHGAGGAGASAPAFEGSAELQAAPEDAGGAQAAGQAGSGAAELQSLLVSALGAEAAERYSPVLSALEEAGMAGPAAELALDAPFLPEAQFDALLNHFVSSLPRETAPGAQQFLLSLADGLKYYAGASGLDITSALPPSGAPLSSGAGGASGVAQVFAQVMDLFARMDAENADPAESLASAAAQQRSKIARVASQAAKDASISPQAKQQASRVEAQTRLLDGVAEVLCKQIPVLLNDRRRTVELYVMNRRGGGKKIRPDYANLLIALDTDHLGRVETLINVSGKTLRVRFGVERPGLVGYVSSFSGELGQAVEQIGYRLSDVRAEVSARRTTPLNVAETVEDAFHPSSALDIKL